MPNQQEGEDMEKLIRAASLNRVLDLFLKMSIPVLFTCFGWAVGEILNHKEQLAIIANTQYSYKDAQKDKEESRKEREAIRAAFVVELKKVSEASPPAWLKEKMERIALGVETLNVKVTELDKRVSKIEPR